MWTFFHNDKNAMRACFKIVENSKAYHTYYLEGDIIDVYKLSPETFLHHMLQDDIFITCDNPYKPEDEKKKD